MRPSYSQLQQNSQALAAPGRRDDAPSDLTIAITASDGVRSQCCGALILIRPAQRAGHGSFTAQDMWERAVGQVIAL